MRALQIALLVTPLFVLFACDDTDDNVVGPSSTAGDMSPSVTDMTPSVTDMSPPTTAQFRFALLSPNKPPVDICIATHGSGQFNGPLLKAAGVAQTGLSYAQVSKYLTVAAGQYDVRVIDGGATSCDQSLFDSTSLPAFTGGGSFTIAGSGFIPPNASDPTGFTIAFFTDDTTNTANAVLVRFIHEAPNVPAVDFGTGAGPTFAALFSDVSYLAVGTSTSPAPDANGYVSLAPATAPVTYSLRTHGSSTDTLTVTSPATLPAGTLATVFAIGDLTGTPRALQTLICADNAAPVGALSSCTTLP